MQMEVANLFSRLIPQRELARYEANRQRQAIIPDLQIVLQVGGLPTAVLHELKCISVSQSRYKPTWEERAVDKRAEQLQREYEVKARTVDQQYCDVEPGQVGPVEAKLHSLGQVRGVVFGAFGEASRPVHDLVDFIATSRVAVAGPQRGRKGALREPEGERAIIVGQVRRKLSVAAIRAQCLSLLGRLQVIGASKELERRRAKALDTVYTMAQDRASFLKSLKNGYTRIRRGFGKVD